MKTYKINMSFFAYINAKDEREAEKFVMDRLQSLIDESEDFEQTDFLIQEIWGENYRYEICNKKHRIIDGGDGYCCLDTAIEYALENGGEYIEQVWFSTNEYGEFDVDDFNVIDSKEVWRRDKV
jgi:hypothetical protein